MDKGLVHIYTGNGKGKTTSAVGLGIRAFGRGFKVHMVQFLKSDKSGEVSILNGLGDGFKLTHLKENTKFIWQMDEDEINQVIKYTKEQFTGIVNMVKISNIDLLILDEILGVISAGLIDIDEVIDLIKEKPKGLELVLTGREAPEVLIELSDYVSEIKDVKHPYNSGINARKGIEF